MQSSPVVARGAARRSPTAALLIALFAVLAATALVARPGRLGEEGSSSAGSAPAPGSKPKSPNRPKKRRKPKSRGTEIPRFPAPRPAWSAAARSPRRAPRRSIKQVIAAANRIRATPYIWGGGHGRLDRLRLRLLRHRLLRAPRRPAADQPAHLWLAGDLGEAGQAAGSPSTPTLGTLHGGRRAAVRHRGRRQRDRPPLAPDHRRGGQRPLRCPPPGRPLAVASAEKGRPSGAALSRGC